MYVYCRVMGVLQSIDKCSCVDVSLTQVVDLNLQETFTYDAL